MIKNHGSTFLKASLKDKDAIKRSLLTNAEKKSEIRLNDLGFLGSNLEEKLRVDDYFGLYSTSQLKDSVDFSKFENHTFYDSAEAKINYAFSRIINNFPFEGTYEDYETFIRNLDGFTFHVLDKIQKNLGYLKFEGDSYIEVKDQSGALFSVGDKNTGHNVLDPRNSQFSFDFWLYVPATSIRENQIVFQKKSTSHNGFTCFLEDNNAATTNVSLIISNLNDSSSQDYHDFIKSSLSITKDKFHHICFNVLHSKGKRIIECYLNGVKKSSSANTADISGLEIENINFRNDVFLIGSGSDHTIQASGRYDSFNVDNALMLTGAIDDFRYFHSVRDKDTINNELKTNIFKSDDLKLYYKFNEPTGSYQNISVVMDHSGNSLHSKIKTSGVVLDYSHLRTRYTDVDTPLIYEDKNTTPVLFPDFPETVTLRDSLFKDAHIYDQNNPNLIFKLFPKQYFDGQSKNEGFDSLYGNINKPFTYREALAGSVTSPAIGNFVSLLLIWARFFDTLKLYIDNYTEIINVDYDNIKDDRPGASVYLPKIAKFLGFNFTQILNSPSVRNLDGRDLQYNNAVSKFKLRKVQNEIWKRILINSQDFIRQKGTADSVKGVIRAAGLDPDIFYNLKEKSGLAETVINESYSIKKESLKSFNFTKDINTPVSFDGTNRSSTNKMFLQVDKLVNTTNGNYPDTFLSSSEAGALNDSSLSGSWELEGFYKFPTNHIEQYSLSQSLGRIVSEGSSGALFPIANLVVNKENAFSNKGTVHFVSRPYGQLDFTETIHLSSSMIPIFDGNIYRVSVGRKKSLQGNRNKSNYFLDIKKCGNSFKNIYSQHKDYYFYDDQNSLDILDLQQKHYSDINQTSNNFSFHLGSFSFDTSRVKNISNTALGWDSIPGLDILTTDFQGEFFNFNLFSKDLGQKERENHARNISSVGTNLPHINYNFNNNTTGSNQRLNLQITAKYQNLSSSWDDPFNKVNLIDKTQNPYTTASFQIRDEGIDPLDYIDTKTYLMSHLNGEIDSIPENNKVRILSDYTEEENIYERPLNFKTEEENRFIVEMSNVLALNKNISTIMSSLDEFNNALGDTATLFDIQYQSLNDLREIYFNNLIDEIDNRAFYDLFVYMDNLISDLISQMIPDKSHYSGHNYTIESHILERHKIQYKYNEARIPTDFRTAKSIRLSNQNILKN